MSTSLDFLSTLSSMAIWLCFPQAKVQCVLDSILFLVEYFFFSCFASLCALWIGTERELLVFVLMYNVEM